MNCERGIEPEGRRLVVIGGGPAGLTAAYEAQRLCPDLHPVVLEAGDLLGGIARTENHHGNRFDIGGHRFFTKVPEVEAMWREVLGDDFITVPRLSRIYYRGRYFNYPLRMFNALYNIGAYEAARIVLSYLRWQAMPAPREDSFEDWVINRFGQRLYMHFFKSYTEKVWGIPPSEIQADWAAQRIKNLSLGKAVWNALTGANSTTSLIEEFQYPRLGPGMLWERVGERVTAAGGEIRMRSRVERVLREGRRITAVELTGPDGTRERLAGGEFVNSMALGELIGCIEPAPPPEVLAAAGRLKYRDFLIVTLLLDHADPFPDNWLYIHEPGVDVGRIQNFRAWSPEMLADPETASIGMEYFCHAGDALWTMSDEALQAKAAAELERLGLAEAETVIDAYVIRQPRAYPVYDSAYRTALETIADWLGTLENFQTVGRNGLHRYNNQDHSMLTAMLAARNLAGERHDLWKVNVERSYLEEFEKPKSAVPEAA
ncbi:NAD(P)/FAD-dependent oxidoreductase [Paralimibaculum aggregatum]|uniref:NAD(P)/FAD-dependent oxidoreductase n=1 Tax=Paralimibaculum aggregatum TaxID=3036245 RepID=UPI0025522EA5|nr:NAD(P)/FAD-dependent oxidoreductase [Limibaculum sp. NKW23]